MNTVQNTNSKKIRSLVLSPFFSHNASTSRPLLVSDVLSRFGTVDIFTTNFDHQKKAVKVEFQFSDNRAIYSIPTLPYSHNISPMRFFSHILFSIRCWLFYLERKNDYDVVYATLPLNLLTFLVFASSSQKIKIVDVIDIWPDVLPFPNIIKAILLPLFFIWKQFFKLAVKNCDILMTVSDCFLRDSNLYFCGLPSSARRFYIGSKSLPHSQKKQYSCLTIAYVGNIGHLYDFETLLQAMTNSPLKPRFFLIGNGDRKDWLLQELKRNKIDHQCFGEVYDVGRLAEILSECHLGFNGYRNTTAAFSYKANTYFAAGLPILNSMGGDLECLVAQYDLGFNYVAGDVASLLTCINCCSPDTLIGMSQNVDRFFMSEIDESKIKDDITNFIKPFIVDVDEC